LNALRTARDPTSLLSDHRQSILRILTNEPVPTASESVDLKKFRRSLEFLVGARHLSENSRSNVD
jgi:hypothetical protein